MLLEVAILMNATPCHQFETNCTAEFCRHLYLVSVTPNKQETCFGFLPPLDFIVLATSECLCGLENVSIASTDSVVSGKLVKFEFWVNYH